MTTTIAQRARRIADANDAGQINLTVARLQARGAVAAIATST